MSHSVCQLIKCVISPPWSSNHTCFRILCINVIFLLDFHSLLILASEFWLLHPSTFHFPSCGVAPCYSPRAMACTPSTTVTWPTSAPPLQPHGLRLNSPQPSPSSQPDMHNQGTWPFQFTHPHYHSCENSWSASREPTLLGLFNIHQITVQFLFSFAIFIWINP